MSDQDSAHYTITRVVVSCGNSFLGLKVTIGADLVWKIRSTVATGRREAIIIESTLLDTGAQCGFHQPLICRAGKVRVA